MVKTNIFPFNPIQTQRVRTLPLKLQAWGNTSTFLPSVKEGIQSPNGSESTHSGNTDRESPPEFWLFTVYSLLSHHTLPILVFLNSWCSMFFKKDLVLIQGCYMEVLLYFNWMLVKNNLFETPICYLLQL